jgi:2-polyprenyl-3-methyl-5-hydroxy-6-metoxy-1,4-benzoquinol methylase
MRAKVGKLVKSLLWKACQRDFVVLNPHWNVIGGKGFQILSNSTPEIKYLPIHYNYHTPKEWQLSYTIRGNVRGILRYTLQTPNTEPFCEVKHNIQLPYTWIVKLNEKGLMGNGNPIKLSDEQKIPRDTPWLIGNFEFLSEKNDLLFRRTGHRVKLERSQAETDENYFNGLIYTQYDEDAVLLPKQVFETIETYHPLQGKFLDVGCAIGLTVEYALTKGLDAEGVDYSAWAIEKANKRTGDRCRTLNFDKANVTDFASSYDIITMHSVIEHLGDPLHALNLLFKICRPNGVVYIQTLNADSLMRRVMGDDWGGYTDYTHQSPWITADWLVNSAKVAGFEVIYQKRYYLWNDNIYDDVWQSFASFSQLYPANIILEDALGDAVELILRRPTKN